MNVKQKISIGVATAAVLAAVGTGVGFALGGDDDNDIVTGPDADQARAAALTVVPGTAGEVEKETNEGNAVYGVDVTKSDGTKLEVHLDKDFHYLGTEPPDSDDD
ncbi:PepSY domain-containing protein [Nocardia sp. CA-135398]|uniref:PepSY domain-containing protein n=1 Tax=Nocardia sp. CA-135398 TaxID=3239977 RepID=UPI003D95C789